MPDLNLGAEELVVLLEEHGELVVTLEEAAVLGTVITPEQGLRGPRGFRGETGPQGDRGDRGLQGVSGGSASELPKWSRGPLSAGSIVRLHGADHCVPVSALDPLDALAPIGLVQHAVSAAEQEVGVLVYGEHEDDTWNWTPGGPLFVGTTGLLTQTLDPAWAFVRMVGTAVTPTLAFIDPQPPVLLAAGV